MKRLPTLILALALLSAGLLAGSGLAVQSRGDQVTVTAQVLKGDPSLVQGLDVAVPTTLGDYLFWTTRFPADRPEQAVTQLRYDPEGLPPLFYDTPISLRFPVGSGVTYHYRISQEQDSLDPNWLAMLEQLAQGMEPGAERSVTVRLADYVDHWPLELFADPDDMYLSSSDGKFLDRLATSYFSIPIPEDYQAKIVQTTDSEGQLELTRIYADERYQIGGGSWGVETPQGILFTLNNTYWDSTQNQKILMDSSGIPGGWGIYRLTLEQSPAPREGEDPPPVQASLETAWSLPGEGQILDFLGSEDGSTLFLLTLEEGMLRLRVFDQAVTLLTTIDLLPMGPSDRYMQTYPGDGFLVPITYGEGDGSYRLAVAASGPEGWGLDFTASLAEQAALGFGGISWLDTYQRSLAMDYADGLLTIRDGGGGTDFHIAVWSRDGLEYLGAYETSLALPAVRQTEGDLSDHQYSICSLPRDNAVPLIERSEKSPLDKSTSPG